MSLNSAGGATFGTPGSGGPGFGGTGFGGPGFGGPQMPPRRGPDDDVIPGEDV